MAVPDPLGQELVNAAASPAGAVARVTVTAGTAPPCADTAMVHAAVFPALMVAWADWTLTHSCGCVPDADGDGDGDGVLVAVSAAGSGSHWEVAAAGAAIADGGEGRVQDGAVHHSAADQRDERHRA